MATQDNSVLGTEEESGFLDQALQGVSNTFDDIGEVAGDAYEGVKDIGSTIGQGIENIAEDLSETKVGEFFGAGKPEPTDIQESAQISKELIKEAREYESNTAWEVIRDLGDYLKYGYTLYGDESIKDVATFRAIQETKKTFADEFSPMATEYKRLEYIQDRTEEEQKKLEDLRITMQDLQTEFNEKEDSLISRAIKGDTLKDKRDKLDAIYSRLESTGEVTSEGKAILEESIKADEFIAKISRDRIASEAFKDINYISSISSLKGSLANEMSSWNVRRRDSLNELINSGASQVDINYVMGMFNEMEDLNKDMIKHTLDSAYKMIDGDKMPAEVARLMGRKKVERRAFLENEIIRVFSEKAGISNWDKGNKITGAAQLLSTFFAKQTSQIRTGIDKKYDTPLDEVLSADAHYLRNFDKSGLDSLQSFLVDNYDDILLGATGVVATTVFTKGALKGTGGLITKFSPRTKQRVLAYSRMMDNSKLARTVFKNRVVGLEVMAENVTLGLTANVIIDTALNDPTSEGRMIMNTGMDIIGGPVFDVLLQGVVGGGMRTLKGAADSFLGVDKKSLAREISKQLGVDLKKGEEFLEIYIDWQKLIQPKVTTDMDFTQFGRDMLARARKSDTGVAVYNNVRAQLIKDSESIVKLDRGLPQSLITSTISKDINLAERTVDGASADRLFREAEGYNTSNEKTFLSDILSNMGVPRDIIDKNAEETVQIGHRLFNIAKQNKIDIERIKTKGVLTSADNEVLINIAEFQKGIDDIAKLHNKDTEYLQLFDADGVVREYKVSELTRDATSGVFRLKKDNTELFDNTSLFNMLKPENAGFANVSKETAYFLKEKFSDGMELTQAQELEAIEAIASITGHRPKVIPMSALKDDTSRVVIYVDDAGLHRISVGNYYFHHIQGSNKKIKLEFSGEKGRKKYLASLRTKEVDIKTGKTVDKKGEGTKTVKNDNIIPYEEVPLSATEIREGRLNRATWNRVLLSEKKMSAIEFDDMISSEAINYELLISGKETTLLNALTLKDVQATKRFIIAKLRDKLAPMFENAVKLDHFIELLESSLFSIGSLNRATRFTRAIGETINKPKIMANYLEGLGLYAANRFKTMDLSTTILSDLNKYTKNTAKAKKALGEILLGRNVTEVLSNLGVERYFPQRLMTKVKNLTGLDFGDELLRHSQDKLDAFVDRLSKVNGLQPGISSEQIASQERRIKETLSKRLLQARDQYLKEGIMDVFQGAESLTALQEGLITRTALTNEDADLAGDFTELLMKQNTIDDMIDAASKFKLELKDPDNFAITSFMKNRILGRIKELRLKNAPIENMTLSDLVTYYNSLTEAIKDTSEQTATKEGFTVLSKESFTKDNDNIVVKSIKHTLNPYDNSIVFDDTLGKKFSDLVNVHILGKKADEDGIFELGQEIRNPRYSLEETKPFRDELDSIREKIEKEFFDISGAKIVGKDINSKNVKAVREFKEAKLKKKIGAIYEGMREETKLGKGEYEVWDGKKMSNSEIAKLAFSFEAGFGEIKDLTKIISDSLALRTVKGYRLNLTKGLYEEAIGYSKNRTIYNHLENDISKGGMSSKDLTFIPIEVQDGKRIYNFIGNDRKKHVHAHNIYKYLLDNPEAKDWKKEFKKLKDLISSQAEGTTLLKNDLTDIGKVQRIGLHFGLSRESYMITLSIGDKDGLGIGFNMSEDYIRNQNKLYAKKHKLRGDEASEYKATLNELYNRATIDFHNRFQAVYKFKGKDAEGLAISTRIGTLAHEDKSLTPGANFETFDIFTEELSHIEIFLSKNRHAQLKDGFNVNQEKRIEFILKKARSKTETPTIEEKEELIDLYFSKPFAEQDLKEMYDTTDAGKRNGIFDYLVGPTVSDGASHISDTITDFLSIFDPVFKKGKGAKFHVSYLGLNLIKTYWNAISKGKRAKMIHSIKAFMGKGRKVGGTTFTDEAVKVVGIESHKVGKKTEAEIKKFQKAEGIKYIEFEDGTKRKILYTGTSNTKDFKSGGKETFEKGGEETGITKQVEAVLHTDASTFLNQGKQDYLRRELNKITYRMGLAEGLPTPSNNDLAGYIKTLKGNDFFNKLPDLTRRSLKKEIQKLLDNISKPKGDKLGMRLKLTPTPMYRKGDELLEAKTNEVYVSKKMYDLIKTESGTMQVGDNYYVMVYRSPVPNSENVALHKVVIDENLETMDSVGVSPIRAIQGLEADNDGDTLNLVYIKRSNYEKDQVTMIEHVHEGGLAAALSFTMKNIDNQKVEQSIIQKFKDETKDLVTVLNDNLIPYATKTKLVKEHIESFIIKFPNHSLPFVNVEQVGDPIKTFDLGKLNTNAKKIQFINGELKTINEINKLRLKNGLNDQSEEMLELIDSLNYFNYNNKQGTFYYGLKKQQVILTNPDITKFLESGKEKPSKKVEALILQYQDKRPGKTKTLKELIETLRKQDVQTTSLAKLQEDMADEIEEQLSEGFSAKRFIKANHSAILSQDGIKLVSATNRTNLAILEISDLYTSENPKYKTDAELKMILGLSELDLSFLGKNPNTEKPYTEDEILTDFKTLFNRLHKINRSTVTFKSSGIFQRTVDAKKFGQLPPNWEKLLDEAAFGSEGLSDHIKKYLEKASMDHSNVFEVGDIDYYAKPYQGKAENPKYKKLTLGRNVEIRNMVEGYLELTNKTLIKNKKSHEMFLKNIRKVEPLNQFSLMQAAKELVKDEDQWMIEAYMRERVAYKLSKLKLGNEITYKYKKGKTPKGEKNPTSIAEGVPVSAKKEKKGKPYSYEKKKYQYESEESMINLSERELKKMGFIFKDSDHVPYFQNDFKKAWKVNYKNYQEAHLHLPIEEDKKFAYEEAFGKGVVMKFGKNSMKEKKELLDKIIEKINIGREDAVGGDMVIVKTFGEGGTVEEHTLTKADIIQQLHFAKGITREEDFLNMTVAQTVFNDEKLSTMGEQALVGHATLKINDIITSTLEKGELKPEEVIKFKKLLEKFPEAAGAVEIKGILGNTAIIEVDGLQPVKQKVSVGEPGEERYFNITNEEGKIYVKDETEEVFKESFAENFIEDNFEVKPNDGLGKIFQQSTPETIDEDFIKTLGMTVKDSRDISVKLDKVLDDMAQSAKVINSKLSIKYLRPEMLRSAHLGTLPIEVEEVFAVIRKKYESDLSLSTRRKLDNMVYYINHAKMNSEEIKKLTDPIEIDYYKEVELFYNEHLFNFVKEKQVNIPLSYNKRGSIVEDLTGLTYGKTLKIPFVENKIFERKGTGQFNDLMRERMKEVGVPYSERVVEDLFGGIFEKSVFDKGLNKALKGVRTVAFQTMLGALTWLSTGAGIIVGLAQIPVEFFRNKSLTKSFDGFSSEEFVKVQREFSLLTNVGVEAAIRVGPLEVNPPWFQGKVFKFLDKMGSVVNINKTGVYQWLTRRVAALGSNPLVITDLAMDGMRKQSAIKDTLNTLGFYDLASFTAHMRNMNEASKESLLSKIRLYSREKYAEISGGVVDASLLYRESYLSRRLLPFNFLMGWSNRLSFGLAEDVALMYKGFKELGSGNVKEGFDIIFNRSQALNKIIASNIVLIGLYAKLQVHDKYDGEYDKRRALVEWIQGMNSNFVSLGMNFPIKIFKAGYKGEGGLEVRASNMLRQVAQDTYRELDLAEIFTSNSLDWLNGKRDMEDVVLSTINAKAQKGLLYNKTIAVENLYPEFRERDEISTMLFLDMKSEDEKTFFEIYDHNSDAAMQALIDSNNHTKLVQESIKALPFLSIALRNKDFDSYEIFERSIQDVLKTMRSDEFNSIMDNPNTTVNAIYEAGYTQDLYKALQTAVYSDGLTEGGEATFEGSSKKLERLTEDLTVHKLKEKYGASYPRIIEGIESGGLEYILTGGTDQEKEINQLMMKITSDFPSSAPYVVGQILKQRDYEWRQKIKKERGYDGVLTHFNESEQAEKMKETLIELMPLINLSDTTRNKVAGYTLVSKHPELIDTIMNNDYIKSSILDRIAMELAVTRSFSNGETNPTYLLTRMAKITGKQDSLLASGDITEEAHKESLLDTFNFGLDRINNNDGLSADQKVELKTAMLKSLGEYGHILEEDPLLSKGFDGARVNLMHKLFTGINELRPYAEEARIDLAESTGQIPTGAAAQTRGYRRQGNSKPKLPNLGKSIPQMMGTLNRPRNKFRDAFQPGKSGFNRGNAIRPFLSSIAKQKGPEEFRRFMIEQRSQNIIKSAGKYKTKPKYVRVGKAEFIKLEKKQYLKPVFSKTRTRGLLKGLPGNRA